MVIPKIDKYIIKKFLGTYIFCILIIISLSVVFDITERLDNFLSKPVTLYEIVFHYYMNFIPYYANLFSSIFVFLAVIFFTSKLANNSEIIAFLSAGVSFKRLLRPYMISAFVIALASFALSSFVIPQANVVRIKFQNKYFKDKSVEYATSVHVQVSKGTILYISRYDNKRSQGFDVSLDHFENKELKSRLIAKQIKYISENKWQLLDYAVRDFKGLKEELHTGTQIDTTLYLSPMDFLVSVNDYDQMTTSALHRYIERQKSRGLANVGGVSIVRFELEYYKRFASFFSAFILTFIGATLSSKKIKGGMGLNLGLGILLSVLYILFSTITSTFSVSGLMPPLLAVWIPNIIYVFIAAALYHKAPN